MLYVKKQDYARPLIFFNYSDKVTKMAIFRKGIPLWKKVLGAGALSTLAISGICILAVEKLSLAATTKKLLGTIAVRAFIAWWILVAVSAVITVIYHRRSKPYFSMYYTSIGILILIFTSLLSVLWSSIFYIGVAISGVLFFYDLLRAWSNKHEHRG